MIEQRDIDRKREELRQHLNEIEDRVNPKKVADRVVGRAQDSYNEDPTPWIAGRSWRPPCPPPGGPTARWSSPSSTGCRAMSPSSPA